MQACQAAWKGILLAALAVFHSKDRPITFGMVYIYTYLSCTWYADGKFSCCGWNEHWKFVLTKPNSALQKQQLQQRRARLDLPCCDPWRLCDMVSPWD